MTTHFTCPHCGKRASTDRPDVEWVELGIGQPPQLFPSLPPGEERHINSRMACESCYAAQATRLPPGAPHPFDPVTHHERLAAVQAAADRAKE